MNLKRQTWTLIKKNLRISVQRHWLSTLIRAVLAPIIFIFIIAYMKNFFVPPSDFGIGSPTPIRSFEDALRAAEGGRNTVALVNNGFTGGQIEQLVNALSETIRASGKTPQVLESEDELLTLCRSSLRGASTCYGAAVFYASPTEGEGGAWNYTLRADGALNANIYVDQTDNDPQIYVIPFQRAIDQTIVNELGDGMATLPAADEFPFTSRNQEEREDNIQKIYMQAVIGFMGIAYILGIIGVVYHLVGRMAHERELGMSQLVEAMVPNRHRWQTQIVRLLALHLAMDIIWLPGWIVMGLILRGFVFINSSFGITVIWQLLSGLAFSSWSIFGASFFRKAQLSGISVIILSLVLAIAVQVQTPDSTAAIAVLGFLFTPCNYIFNVIYMGRFERVGAGANLVESAPVWENNSTWEFPGIALWVFLIIQIIVYPILGGLIERSKFGTSSKERKVLFGSDESANSPSAITLRNFSKSYVPGWWSAKVGPLFGGDKRSVVQAVKGLDLEVLRGQILCLLGANGSGKSTTLDAITGLNTVTGGELIVDGNGGIGYCPQKNVLWDELTVFEHVKVFNGLKSPGKLDTKEEIEALIKACDLEHKVHAKSKTLSGGQKRKLQLAMMFTGGSHVCCIDEISSGLDPLSRRKIWTILLNERQSRTLLLTTHFLDEAEALSDHIVVMSKGRLKAEGSAAELKHRFGGNYSVEVKRSAGGDPPVLSGLKDNGNVYSTRVHRGAKDGHDRYHFECDNSFETTRLIQELEREGYSDYTVHGPSIEDVFLTLSEEAHEDGATQPTLSKEHLGDEPVKAPITGYAQPKLESFDLDTTQSNSDMSTSSRQKHLGLLTGTGSSFTKQTWVLFRKRVTVLRRNYIPYLLAVLIPIIVAGLVTFFLNSFDRLTCSPTANIDIPDIESFGTDANILFIAGPQGAIDPTLVEAVTRGNTSWIQFVDTFDDFNNQIETRYANITPGGMFLGDTPVMAYRANYLVHYAVVTQNFMNQALSGQRIVTQYSQFAVPWAPNAGDSLQLVFYFGLAMCAMCGFFALYPTRERLTKVRALHYSNGIRAAPLWLAYLCFDFIFVLIISVVVTAIWAGVSSVWFHIEYLFVVFFLFGIASTLAAYAVSLFTSSLLATFAWAVGFQASMFALYFVAYMSILTFAPVYEIDNYIEIAHWTIALITPSGNLLRSLLLTLNIFSITCDGDQYPSYPGAIEVYGGPILYLTVQSILLFIFLVWYDSGYSPAIFSRFSRKRKSAPETTTDTSLERGDDVLAEISRTESSKAGLRVQHVVRSFAEVVAVEDVTFGIAPSECFALLGPNGAGKSTTISLIRGDLRPDHGDVLVEGTSITRQRAIARKQLGVCPQFDAMDNMTVSEHLRFYAKARGVSDPSQNVDTLISAVRLSEYRDRLAHKLSGGNKRKLSLAIALIGNPAVLLLDEPSSGMDAASKRFLWRVLADVTKGRSMLITTHSLEEADRLADNVGIMATRMLALGTSDALRDRFGERLYVHLVLRGAPHVPDAETQRVRAWVEDAFEGVQIEERMWYGQLRFSVPVASSGFARLYGMLEENREALGLEVYSVNRATLDEVFLEVVTRHDIEEEGAGRAKPKRKWWRKLVDDA